MVLELAGGRPKRTVGEIAGYQIIRSIRVQPRRQFQRSGPSLITCQARTFGDIQVNLVDATTVTAKPRDSAVGT